MPLTSLLSHGTDGAFHRSITCRHTHAHTHFLSGDDVVICDAHTNTHTLGGQEALMNSTPHAVSALS